MLAYDMNVMFCGRAREGRNRGSCGERGDPGPPPSGPGGVASAPGEHDGGGGREVVAGPVLVDPRHGHAVAPWHGGRVPLLLLRGGRGGGGLGHPPLRRGADELPQVLVGVGGEGGAARRGEAVGAEAHGRGGEGRVAEGGVPREVAGAPGEAAHVQVPRGAQRPPRPPPQPAQVVVEEVLPAAAAAAAAPAHGDTTPLLPADRRSLALLCSSSWRMATATWASRLGDDRRLVYSSR